MNKAVGGYKTFVFKSYHFDQDAKTLSLRYGFDTKLTFTETFTFNFDFKHFDPKVLDRAIQNLFFMAGVSYYKAFPTQEMRIDHGTLDTKAASFFAATYQKGLGEYFYVNKLDPRTEIPFTANSANFSQLSHANNNGILVGIGGGKDSLLSAEIFKDVPNAHTWSLGHRQQLEPLVRTIGLPHYWVDRKIDPLLLELNNEGALNGHIPISAIFGCVGTVVAVLTGLRDVSVSNENSANEVSLHYNRVPINHQYSKSLEYEHAYQKYLDHCFGDSLRFYSTLRPLSEIRIAELFSKNLFSKYKTLFSSCNRAFIQSSDRMSWCGFCPKCAFTFLALTPFVEREELLDIWHKNLLSDPVLITTYLNLLGISGNKPLDCVGEVKESRQAMRMSEKKYPYLERFEYDIPDDYDYKALAPHAMPDDVYKKFETFIPTI